MTWQDLTRYPVKGRLTRGGRFSTDLWFETGIRRISLRPISGRIQSAHKHGSAFLIAILKQL